MLIWGVSIYVNIREEPLTLVQLTPLDISHTYFKKVGPTTFNKPHNLDYKYSYPGVDQNKFALFACLFTRF